MLFDDLGKESLHGWPTEGAFCLFKLYWKGKLNQKTFIWEFQMEVTVSFGDL